MRERLKSEDWAKAKVWLAVFAIGILLVGILLYLQPLLSGIRKFLTVFYPFLIGIALAFIQYPIVRRMDRLFSKIVSRKKSHPKLSRALSATVSLALLLAIVSVFLGILMPQLIHSIRQLVNTVNRFLQSNATVVNDFLAQHELDFVNLDGEKLQIAWEELITRFSSYGDAVISGLLTISATVSAALYNTIYPIFIGIIAAFYFLMDKELCCALRRKISYALFDRPVSEKLIGWTRRAVRIFNGFITGKLLDSLIVGVICYVAMLIFGFEYPLLISVIIGITNILPVFGPFIGAIPSILILLIVNPMHALWFALFILILQQIDGHVIGPLILKDYVDIRPLWILISVTVGGGLFGFVGMLLSIPTFSLGYAIAQTVLDKRLREKDLPDLLDDYRSEAEMLAVKKEGAVEK